MARRWRCHGVFFTRSTRTSVRGSGHIFDHTHGRRAGQTRDGVFTLHGRSTPRRRQTRRPPRAPLLRYVPARTTAITRRASPLGPAGRFATSLRRAAGTRCARPCTKTRHDTRTAVECSQRTTRKAMPAVARRYRAHCRRSSDLSTQRGRPCARSREASEHGRPAHRPAGLRSSLRECARQDRGEVRAHGPRGPSYTRRSPRLSSINGRKAEAMTATAASPTRSAHTSIRADARAATISATSRREPQPSRVGLLPSDLPGASRRPHAEPRAHGARGHARRRVTTRARPSNALSTRRGRPCARSRDATARTAEEALI
jgi:hypothetical protein